jgi:hypothetical protein
LICLHVAQEGVAFVDRFFHRRALKGIDPQPANLMASSKRGQDARQCGNSRQTSGPMARVLPLSPHARLAVSIALTTPAPYSRTPQPPSPALSPRQSSRR